MIPQFVQAWHSRKGEIEANFRAGHPANYLAIVKSVIEILGNTGSTFCDTPDPDRITVIDHGDYQGTLLFVIGAQGYQPSRYWYVLVSYGSCSGCDTLEGIRDYSSEIPSNQQVRDYMTLALHVLQGLKAMEGG